jgi:hypothetical protein
MDGFSFFGPDLGDFDIDPLESERQSFSGGNSFMRNGQGPSFPAEPPPWSSTYGVNPTQSYLNTGRPPSKYAAPVGTHRYVDFPETSSGRVSDALTTAPRRPARPSSVMQDPKLQSPESPQKRPSEEPYRASGGITFTYGEIIQILMLFVVIIMFALSGGFAPRVAAPMVQAAPAAV